MVFWEVALIMLLFVGVSGLLAMPALAGIRATVEIDRDQR
jgi:hypothetical protein